MGGLPIQMPSLGRAASRGQNRDEARIVSWFDDALPRLFGYFLPRVGALYWFEPASLSATAATPELDATPDS